MLRLHLISNLQSRNALVVKAKDSTLNVAFVRGRRQKRRWQAGYLWPGKISHFFFFHEKKEGKKREFILCPRQKSCSLRNHHNFLERLGKDSWQVDPDLNFRTSARHQKSQRRPRVTLQKHPPTVNYILFWRRPRVSSVGSGKTLHILSHFILKFGNEMVDFVY